MFIMWENLSYIKVKYFSKLLIKKLEKFFLVLILYIVQNKLRSYLN